MKKLFALLTMLPLEVLADVPRPMRLSDLGVSSLLFVYWTVLAFATGMSIVLWKFRSSMKDFVVPFVMMFGALSVTIFCFDIFGEVGWLFCRWGIPVAAAMFVAFVVINKVCQRRWKRWLIFLPLAVMTVWWLLGFKLIFVECKTCDSTGVIRGYNLMPLRCECDCCKGRRCHLRLTHTGCVVSELGPMMGNAIVPPMDVAEKDERKR